MNDFLHKELKIGDHAVWRGGLTGWQIGLQSVKVVGFGPKLVKIEVINYPWVKDSLLRTTYVDPHNLVKVDA